ncbi:glutaredoxin-like protein [Enterococcus phage Phi_Eg_SY1]|nr:glutaredoxin-like protein [Enterococcus phage Phi_Eg_SY1]
MIKVYSKNNCMQCKMVKRFLNEHGLEYSEINIEEQPEARDYLMKMNLKTVPVTEVDGEVIIGFNITELRQLIK